MFRFATCLLLAASLAATARLHADPFEEIAAFSALAKVDRAKVEKGDIFSARVPSITPSRGQVIESVFLVEAPVGKTVRSLREWNGSRHSDLKVYLHGDLAGAGGPGDYARLAAGVAAAGGAGRAFATAEEKELLLAAPEAAKLPPAGSDARPAFWAGLLQGRARAYASGGLPAQPPTGTAAQRVTAAADLAALLKNTPRYAAAFASLLPAVGVAGAPTGKPELYWELCEVDGVAAVTQGASVAGESATADVQFYASGGAYVVLTLHRLWPIATPRGAATLVWRGDLLSAPALGELHGLERSAGAAAVSKGIIRTIGFFQKDAAAP